MSATATASSSEAVTVKTTKRKVEEKGTTRGKKKKAKTDLVVVVDTDNEREKRKHNAIIRSLPPKPDSAWWFVDSSTSHFNSLKLRSHLNSLKLRSLMQTSTPESIREACNLARRMGGQCTHLSNPSLQSVWLDIKQVEGVTEGVLYDLLSALHLLDSQLSELISEAVSHGKSLGHLRAILKCVSDDWIYLDESILWDMISRGKLYTTPDMNAVVAVDDRCTCIFCGVLDRISPDDYSFILNNIINAVIHDDTSGRFLTSIQVAVYTHNDHAVQKLLQYIPLLEIDTCKWEWADPEEMKQAVLTSKWEPITSFFTRDTPPVIRQSFTAAYEMTDGVRWNRSEAIRDCLYNSGMDFGLFDIIDSYNDEPSITRLARRILGERS